MSQNKNRIFFRNREGFFYDGKRSYREPFAEVLKRIIFPWEKGLTIYDICLNENFEEYYNAFTELGFVDIANEGVSLDTPEGAFGYVVESGGEAVSMIAKLEDYNWLHIYNSNYLFEGLDNGRQVLEGAYKFREMGAKGGTLSSVSSSIYKKSIGASFPSYYTDSKKGTAGNMTFYDYIRKSYRVGWNYLDKRHEGETVKDGYIYDVNSLYPYIFSKYPIPCGYGRYEVGAPNEGTAQLIKANKAFAFIRCEVDIKLKKGGLPFIVVNENEPPTERAQAELVLTYPELVLMYRCYDVKKIEFIDYIFYSAKCGVGKNFVNHFYEKKASAEGIDKKIYKGVLNYLTGSFAKKMTRHNLVKIGDNWRMKTVELTEPSYIQVGSAITSWARYLIVTDALKNYENFIYTDTDSLHLTKEAQGIELGAEMGKYKLQDRFIEACYMKRKWYGYTTETGHHLITAGIPSETARQIERENTDKSITEIMELLTV